MVKSAEGIYSIIINKTVEYNTPLQKKTRLSSKREAYTLLYINSLILFSYYNDRNRIRP